MTSLSVEQIRDQTVVKGGGSSVRSDRALVETLGFDGAIVQI